MNKICMGYLYKTHVKIKTETFWQIVLRCMEQVKRYQDVWKGSIRIKKIRWIEKLCSIC